MAGPSGPGGTLNVTFREPANLTLSYANYTVDPLLVASGSAYTYTTSFGNFTFPAPSPHLMAVSDLNERQLANASTFVVESVPATSISDSRVLSADNSSFKVEYNVTAGGVFQGTVALFTTFDALAPPKITAQFNQDPNSTLVSWHFRWKVVTAVFYLKTSENSTFYFWGLPAPVPCTSIPLCDPNGPSGLVGPVGDVPLWNSTLSTNWSDAGHADLSVGPVAIDASNFGFGLVVDFPEGMATIDPSLVAWSGDVYATRFSTQKKVLYHEGRYFAFFSHGAGGSNGIRYAVAREDPWTGNGGSSWSTPTTVTSERINWWGGFDIAHRNGVVGLAWFNEWGKHLWFKKGVIRDGRITWDDAVSLFTNSCTEGSFCSYVHPVSVAIDDLGYFWVAAPRYLDSAIKTFRSSTPEGTSFSSEGDLRLALIQDYRESIRLVPLPGGDLRIVSATYETSYLYWRTWSLATGEWVPTPPNPPNSWGGALPTMTTKVHLLSAADDGQGRTQVVFINNLWQVRMVNITGPGTPDWGWLVGASYSAYPTIQHDPNGDTHLFWARRSCTTCAYDIQYRRMNRDATWIPTQTPFEDMGAEFYLSSMDASGTQRAFLVFSSPTYANSVVDGSNVYFASLATRRGGGGAGGETWNRPGISPQGAYFNQISEYVAPGTGLLTVKHADLAMPGRGLDLSLERLYRTPEAFVFSQAQWPPWDYDELGLPFYSLGKGWSLNFPWVTRNYVYLWDGQRYMVRWDHNVFENTEGTYFKLVRASPQATTLTLTTKSGISYWFSLSDSTARSWRLDWITDTNSNTITFNYDSTTKRLTSIRDTMSNTAVFDYTPVPNLCDGSGLTPPLPLVCKITYGGRTIKYDYTTGRLANVLRFPGTPAEQTTSYEYCSVLTCAYDNPWLLRATIYDTHARTEYEYQQARVGTDAYAYLVDTQTVEDDGGNAVRRRVFDYDVSDGAVTYSKVWQHDGKATPTLQGTTIHNFDAAGKNMRVAPISASGAKLLQQRTWNGPYGPLAQEAMMGSAAVAAGIATYSTGAHYDEYGNVVYSRDPEGRESFMSYVHSNNQSAFYGPGRLALSSPATDGKWLHDDFWDHDASDWGKDTQYGSVRINCCTFKERGPSLEVRTTSTLGYASAWKQYLNPSDPRTDDPHLINALVMVGNAGIDYPIHVEGDVDGQSYIRIQVKFGANNQIQYLDGSTWRDAVPYLPGRWYTLTIAPATPSASLYDFYVDGQKIGAGGFVYYSSGSVDTVLFRGGSTGSLTALWVNDLAVFAGKTLEMRSLTAGKRVRALDLSTGKRLVPDVAVAAGQTTATLTFDRPDLFPRMTLQVLDRDWSPIYTSPIHEFWGGSAYDFNEPFFLSPMKKTSSGFLRSAQVWVEDIEPGTPTTDGEAWSWKTELALSGTYQHESANVPGRHGHGFTNYPSMTTGANDYFIQYEYLESDQFAAEILLPHQLNSDSTWTHRGVWGAHLDGFGSDNGTWGRRWMGFIPPVTDRWMMTIIRASDIGPSAATWKGLSYYLFSGGGRWDVSARGDYETGRVRVSTPGLPDGATITLWDKTGSPKATAAVSGGSASLALYATADSFRNAFPSVGRFTVQSGTTTFESPWYEIFGGDMFEFKTSDNFFLDNSGMDPDIKDRPAGTYRLQAPGVSQETYFLYDTDGNLKETKVRGPTPAGGGSRPWISTVHTYDPWGNILSVKAPWDDTSDHETFYDYTCLDPYTGDPGGYVWKVRDSVTGFTGDLTAAFAYDCAKGIVSSVSNARGYATSYTYDDAGRLKTVTRPGGAVVQYDYYDLENLMVVKDENFYDADGDGFQDPGDRLRQTWQCFDVLGRLETVLRFTDSGPGVSLPANCNGAGVTYYSKEIYTYNWQDAVVQHDLFASDGTRLGHEKREYDFLGRLTRVYNPDELSWVGIAYDDATNTKTVSVDDAKTFRKTQYLYDWTGTLEEVRLYTTATNYLEWSYTYGLAGNLLTVTTPPDSRGSVQVTQHEYDELSQLKRTQYPNYSPTSTDKGEESYTYYKSGALHTKVDRRGLTTTYTIDELRRTKSISHPGGVTTDYEYDENGNVKFQKYGAAGSQVELAYTYTNRDGLATEALTIPGTGGATYTVGYAYDRADNLLSIDYPASGDAVFYAYDAFNRACAALSTAPSSPPPETDTRCGATSGFYAKVLYRGDDLLDTVTYGNTGTSVTAKYTYDNNGRPSTIETRRETVPTPTRYLKMTYGDYDSLGSPLWVKHEGQGITDTYECYSYDALGRLATTMTAITPLTSPCTYSSAGSWKWKLTYDYDALSNRKSLKDETNDPTQWTYYTYDTYSRLCRTAPNPHPPTDCTTMNGPGYEKYQYDGLGRVEYKNLDHYSWGEEGQISSIWTYEGFSGYFSYDGAGRRVKSSVGGTVTHYVYSGLSAIWEKDPTSGAITRYVFLGGLRVAKVTSATTKYYAYDALGNVRVVLASDGTRDATLAYVPFGLCAPVGSQSCTAEPRYAYTGEYREQGPGLDLVYLHSRWYDPALGRFLSPDDRLGSLANPQDQNRYAYVVNNPLKYTDPTGHDIVGDLGNFAFCLFFSGICLARQADATAAWYGNTDDANRAGFWWGIAYGFLVGVVIGLLAVAVAAGCAASAGIACPFLVMLAFGVAAGILGGLAAQAAYAHGTREAGGTPTWEGAGHAGAWGTQAAGVGFGVGAAAGARMLPARGATAPEAAEVDFAPGNPKSGFPGGRAKVLGHRPSDVPEVEWLQGVRRIANDPEVATLNPGGGYRAYGFVRGEPVRVVVGTQAGRRGGIITAHVVDPEDIPFYRP